MLHTKVHVNRSTVSKEEEFLDFYHIWAWKPSGHVTTIILTYFHCFVPKSFHTKFGQKGQVVSEKNKFKSVNDLVPKSRNDIDLEYLSTLTYSSSCLLLHMFRSQSVIV